MADLSRNLNIRRLFPQQDKVVKWVLDNSAAQHTYRGQPIILDITEDTVYGRVYLDTVTVAADDILLGIALEECEVATADTEVDNEIEILIEGVVGFPSTVFTDADVGDLVYMSAFGTLSSTAADNAMLGRLFMVEDGYCYVHINGENGAPSIQTGA